MLPKERRGNYMKLLFISPNDWGGVNYLTATGINKYTDHTARSITDTHHPFCYDTDIVLSDLLNSPSGMDEVHDLIANADFFCIAQGYPPSISKEVEARRTAYNSFVRHSGSDLRTIADLAFTQQLKPSGFYHSFTAYDFTMTRCLVQSYHHNTHIIDTDRWRPVEEKIDEDRPIVIYHSPTNNAIKGTSYIQAAIQNLSKKYTIEWSHTGCIPSGLGGITWAEVMKQKQQADIFVDSVEFHEHGQNAVEAMCFGIPVLNRLSDYYLALYPDTPIIHTDRDNIEENLERFIAEPGLRQFWGAKTREYCVEMFGIERRVQMWMQMIEFIMSFGHRESNDTRNFLGHI